MGNEEKLKEIGARLRAARQVAGFTMETIAARLRERGFKATKAAVGHWETGKRSVDVLIVAELAKLYQQSIDALVWENALSMEAMRFAAQFDSLTDEQQRTLRAIWMAFISETKSGASLPVAPLQNTAPQ